MSRHATLCVGGRELELESIRDGGGKGAVARFAGIADRTAAEALRGSLVEVDRASLPPLEEGEYYHADIIGLPCVDQAGSAGRHGRGGREFRRRRPARSRKARRPPLVDPVPRRIADYDGERIILDPDFLA